MSTKIRPKIPVFDGKSLEIQGMKGIKNRQPMPPEESLFSFFHVSNADAGIFSYSLQLLNHFHRGRKGICTAGKSLCLFPSRPQGLQPFRPLPDTQGKQGAASVMIH